VQNVGFIYYVHEDMCNIKLRSRVVIKYFCHYWLLILRNGFKKL